MTNYPTSERSTMTKHDTTDDLHSSLGVIALGTLLMPFTLALGLPVALFGLAMLRESLGA